MSPDTDRLVNDPQLFDLNTPESLSDQDLLAAVTVLLAEQKRRAVERCDPTALIERAFAEGFLPTGLPRDPYLVEGILVCAGAKIDRSAMNHRCAFVRLGEQWVWEADERLEDSVRYLPGPQSRMQSVTLVAVSEGTPVDLIEARTRQGVHELVGVRSFLVSGGALELVSQRSVSRVSHR